MEKLININQNKDGQEFINEINCNINANQINFINIPYLMESLHPRVIAPPLFLEF